MLKEVHVILWDQITAQIFPVHRVLCVSMAALPMNLNAKIKKVWKEKMRKKQTRRHFFKNLGAIFCAILVIMAFIFESYGPYSKKSSPSQQCKQTKNNLFLSFLNYLSLLIWRIISKNKTSQNNKFKHTCFQNSQNRSSEKTRQQKILQHFNTSLFQENRVFSYLIIPHTFCKNWDR